MWNGYLVVGCVGTNESVFDRGRYCREQQWQPSKRQCGDFSYCSGFERAGLVSTETRVTSLSLDDSNNYTATDFEDELQQSLKQDPNQSDLWFKLGGVYMQKGEFDAAFTCYDYAIRLDPQAPSGLYAAKATALYYLSSQAMSDDVNALLEHSMQLDPNDRTALMLIATDHFISMRYQQAIDAWTQILDSNQKGIDRVSIIHSINQAKQMIR